MRNLSAFVWLGIGILNMIISCTPVGTDRNHIITMVALGVSTILFKITEESKLYNNTNK